MVKVQREAAAKMSGVDTRHISRDSLFLMAELRLDGAAEACRVKVRNLSSGGMMAEGGPAVLAGTHLSIFLKNIGWVDGNVAWVQDNRFGIAFAKEIDPKLPRQQVGNGDLQTPRFIRTPVAAHGTGEDRGPMRKL